MKEVHVFILVLLCACGGVNVLLYSLHVQNKEHLTEDFIVLRNSDNSKASKSAADEEEETEYDEDTKWTNLHDPANSTVGVSNRKLRNAKTQVSEFQTLPSVSFIINPYLTCTRNLTWQAGDQWDMIVIVMSTYSNFIRRNAIRNTWASVTADVNSKVLFLLGEDRTKDLQSQVEKESELYGDIIQTDVVDTYVNLTYKSIAMVQWMNDYCPNSKYYFKVDDDVYANLENILQQVDSVTEDRFFYCHVFKQARPDRNKHSKWYISKDQFPGEFYPMYCSGTGYVFSSSIVNDLLLSTRRSKWLDLEDVFLTGVSAEGLGLTHVHNGGFAFYKREPTGCAFEKALTGHQATAKQMFIIFSQLQSKEIDCETKKNKFLERAEQVG